jgi:hypothetical protein
MRLDTIFNGINAFISINIQIAAIVTSVAILYYLIRYFNKFHLASIKAKIEEY